MENAFAIKIIFKNFLWEIFPQGSHNFFSSGASAIKWDFFSGCDLCDNLFCLEYGSDLLGKVFSNLAGMHEIGVDFWRDT